MFSIGVNTWVWVSPLTDDCHLALDTYHLNIEEKDPAQAARAAAGASIGRPLAASQDAPATDGRTYLRTL
ncbi:putative sugar phosphate isomerase/epimerase [[Actinomadura] parvosata subsp. kistnae]|nr:hypothetical protein [Nonomuraea sp. ATCC 55076]SPL89393.1 putative sugar phosphate isomerase/epimerase [Actinomadura parvosata subsp. kistnae]